MQFSTCWVSRPAIRPLSSASRRARAACSEAGSGAGLPLSAGLGGPGWAARRAAASPHISRTVSTRPRPGPAPGLRRRAREGGAVGASRSSAAAAASSAAWPGSDGSWSGGPGSAGLGQETVEPDLLLAALLPSESGDRREAGPDRELSPLSELLWLWAAHSSVHHSTESSVQYLRRLCGRVQAGTRVLAGWAAPGSASRAAAAPPDPPPSQARVVAGRAGCSSPALARAPAGAGAAAQARASAGEDWRPGSGKRPATNIINTLRLTCKAKLMTYVTH